MGPTQPTAPLRLLQLLCAAAVYIGVVESRVMITSDGESVHLIVGPQSLAADGAEPGATRPLTLLERLRSGRRRDVARWMLEAAVVAAAAYGYCVLLHNALCGALFVCGCTWNWAGGWDACNVSRVSAARLRGVGWGG